MGFDGLKKAYIQIETWFLDTSKEKKKVFVVVRITYGSFI